LPKKEAILQGCRGGGELEEKQGIQGLERKNNSLYCDAK